MKAVIALVIALALLVIGIPLSRAISDGDKHTITRTVEPVTPAQERDAASAKRDSASNKPASAKPDATVASTPSR
ncbi:hypothetical protein SAMN05428989_1196 [Pseudoxanthomonas sp. GM95]|uniref:hypothetical protein n=1 Tax=Pseudoxanthomonas sp. GM95 TaxID=1881043 RepID=UPI0008CD43B3|nr:hypothetical protein [Pseudoxanthomonas sp. GM95]SEK98068.1 hypothetical protein SAMN05428989_1196 [Pseudoxanthomonas sp. GM95]